MSEALPILYSFRRCPYAMRARMALSVASVAYEHREILLRDKPMEMTDVSAKATVPVLVVGDAVLDESLDIMLWALAANDPDKWLSPQTGNLASMLELIKDSDDGFKTNLDIYKYASRHKAGEGDKARDAATVFLNLLDKRLHESAYLFGADISLVDVAIFPFVRQFAGVDRAWFDAQAHAHLYKWLKTLEGSGLFKNIMAKHSLWVAPEN